MGAADRVSDVRRYSPTKGRRKEGLFCPELRTVGRTTVVASVCPEGSKCRDMYVQSMFDRYMLGCIIV